MKNFLSSLCLDENQNVKPKISVVAEEILYIEGIMEHILKEFTDKPLGYYSVIQAYMELLITVLARSYASEENEQKRVSKARVREKSPKKAGKNKIKENKPISCM